MQLLLTYTCIHVSEFTEYPSNITQPVGSVAVFRCRHPSADGIGWIVNGTSLTQIPASEITNDFIIENDVRIFRLIIPTNLEYNGTVVVCVATFFDGLTPSVFTPPVTLSVITGQLAR